MKSRIWARSGPKSYKVATHFVKHVYQQNICLGLFMFKTNENKRIRRKAGGAMPHRAFRSLSGSCCKTFSSSRLDKQCVERKCVSAAGGGGFTGNAVPGTTSKFDASDSSEVP